MPALRTGPHKGCLAGTSAIGGECGLTGNRLVVMTSPELGELRSLARRLFTTGVEAADPAFALCNSWRKNPPPSPRGNGKNIVIAFGKAAVTMLMRTRDLLGYTDKTTYIAVTNDENHRQVHGARVFAAGHPVPDERGVRAASMVADSLRAATDEDVVIVLISGGGSALLPAPVPGLSLEDKSRTTDILLRAGLDICQINAVRQHLSRLKGGGMAKLAHPARVFAYILSDVPGDHLSVVASGPTAGQLMSHEQVVRMLERRNLLSELPGAARDLLTSALADSDPHASMAACENDVVCINTLIGGNSMSLSAIVESVDDFPMTVAESDYSLDVEVAGQLMLDHAIRLPHGTLQGLVFGGESHVRVRGSGLGGRNQELALRFAVGARKRGLHGNWVFLSGGTDGRDGPTDSAGAAVDRYTLDRMVAMGIDPSRALAQNDSYPALAASGDHLHIGGTGTNVADIQVFLRK